MSEEVDVDQLELGEEGETSSEENLKKPSGKSGYEGMSYDEKLERFPIRYIRLRLPSGMGQDIYLNWFTSLFGFAFLWGFAIWCMVSPDAAFEKLNAWQSAVTSKFTWFYIVANPAFTFFTFWLAYRYGDVRLGKTNEKPEFSDMSYFMMLFSAGIAVGLFVSYEEKLHV